MSDKPNKQGPVINKCSMQQTDVTEGIGNQTETEKQRSVLKVNRQQPRSARLRPMQKIPTPIKLLISPLQEMIIQICKKYGLENSQDKKTTDDTCDIFHT